MFLQKHRRDHKGYDEMINDEVDTDSIKNQYTNVAEINQVVGIWEVSIVDCPIDFKIKVLKIPHITQAPYMGFANYSIQSPIQADPYISLHNCKTIQEALDDSLKGFLHYFNKEEIEHTDFVLNDDW